MTQTRPTTHDAAGGASPLGLRALLASDVDGARITFGSPWTHLFPNVFAVASFRIAHWLDVRGHRLIAGVVSVVCYGLTGAEIRPGARIGPGFVLVHPNGVNVSSDVVAGARFVLFGKNTIGRVAAPGEPKGGGPQIGDDVMVGTTSSILGPVTIGDRANIGAHCLVIEDMPAGSVARATPAVIRQPRTGAPG